MGKKFLKSGVTLLAMVLCYFSYEGIGALVFTFAPDMLPAGLAEDIGFLDTLSCLVLLVFYLIWLSAIRPKKETGHKQKESLINRSSLPGKAAIIVVIALGMGAVSNLWLILVDLVLYKVKFIGESYTQMQEAFADMESGKYIFALLSIAIVGPIVEEVLFRGLLYTFFQQLSKHAVLPILGTATLFGIWHGFFVQAVYAGFCGLVFALVYYLTGDLKYPIAVHIINNTLSFVSSVPLLETPCYYLDMAGMALIIPMFLLLGYMLKDMGQRPAERRQIS